jgi:hypothetical protein
MRINHTCIRCRHEFGTIEIQGGHPSLMPFLQLGSTSSMCPKCGGDVFPVTDEETLSFEFVATKRRVLRASLWSALTGAFVWIGFAIAIRAFSSEAQTVEWFPRWLWLFPAVGGGFSFLLAWLLAKMSKARGVNAPHKKGTPNPAEFGSVAPLFLPIIGVFVAFFVWGAPGLAGDALHAGWIRGIIGAFAAFVTTGNVLRQVFKHGRRPPVRGKHWRFGEAPQ